MKSETILHMRPDTNAPSMGVGYSKTTTWLTIATEDHDVVYHGTREQIAELIENFRKLSV